VTVGEAVVAAAGRLAEAGWSLADGRRDAALLARHALGWSVEEWIAGQAAPLPPDLEARLDAWTGRRARHEPLAYITGTREFYGRAFAVTPAVLIPRPESELLVEEALAWLSSRARNPPVVVDVGTGSGCLAITLALERPDADVAATDTSADALEVARCNARRLGADRVRFEAASGAGGTPAADLIVANPPYIPLTARGELPLEVAAYEPASALFGGLDGLEGLRLVIDAAQRVLVPGGRLLMEIGHGQASEATRLVEAAAPLRLDRIRPDLQGIPRVVIAGRD
jgi:release factor glutamine methyltransferase